MVLNLHAIAFAVIVAVTPLHCTASVHVNSAVEKASADLFQNSSISVQSGAGLVPAHEKTAKLSPIESRSESLAVSPGRQKRFFGWLIRLFTRIPFAKIAQSSAKYAVSVGKDVGKEAAVEAAKQGVQNAMKNKQRAYNDRRKIEEALENLDDAIASIDDLIAEIEDNMV